MNVSEGNQLNVVLAGLFGPLHGEKAPTREQFVSACAQLAERSNATLHAGYSGGLVVGRADKLRLRVRP